MRLPWSHAALAMTLVHAISARAAPPTVDWQAPDDCPRAEVVQAAVARALSSRSDASALHVHARIAREREGYQLDLTLRTAHAVSERRLHAARCDTFVALIALELGVMATLPPAAAPHRATAADHDDGIVERRLAWGVRASMGVGTGPLPKPAPRFALQGALWVRPLRVELGAAYDLRRTLHYRELASVGGQFELIAGLIRACYAPLVGPLELPLCAGMEAGALRGHGKGVMNAQRVSRPWLAVTAVAGLRFPATAALAAVVQLEGSLGLLRPTYGVRNLPPLYRPERFDVRGLLGAELQFD